MSNFLDEQLLELHLCTDEFLLDVSKNARIDDSLSSKKGNFMFFFAYYRVSLVGLTIDLL